MDTRLTMSDSIQELTQKILTFTRARGWDTRKGQNQKSLAISTSLEASELLEHFQWLTDAEIDSYIASHREELADEVADVAIYAFQFAHGCGIDLGEAMERKMEKNGEKYPIFPSLGENSLK